MTASGVFSRSRWFWGVGSGGWGVGETDGFFLRLPTPHSPLPSCDQLNLRKHLAMKPFARELRRVRANRGAVPRAAFRVVERRAERVYRRVLEKNPRDAVDDRVADAAGAEGDDGRAEGHRLERRDAEIFDAGEDQASSTAEVIDDHVPRYGPEELNVGPAAGAKRTEKRTATNDDERSEEHTS